jgi:hypothetical protein
VRLSAAVLLTVVTGAQAAPDPKSWQWIGEQTKECYLGMADFYGSKSCHPPSELVNAIYGACDGPEEMLEQRYSAQVNPDAGRLLIPSLRKLMRPLIDKAVLNAQIK